MKTDVYSILTPEEGMMLYCESKNIYSDKVYIGRLDDADQWREVPMAQYTDYLAEEQRKAEEMERMAHADDPV